MSKETELKAKAEKKAKELWTVKSPSAVQCRTCKFAIPDTKYTKGCEKANCLVFADEDKPKEVLWDGASCDFYVKRK